MFVCLCVYVCVFVCVCLPTPPHEHDGIFLSSCHTEFKGDSWMHTFPKRINAM